MPTSELKEEGQRVKPTCSVEGCGGDVIAKGWCDRHYRVARRNNGDPLAPDGRRRGRPKCAVDGCTLTSEKSSDLCNPHGVEFRKWQKANTPNPICSVEGCEKPAKKKGMCEADYRRALAAEPKPECIEDGCDRPRGKTYRCDPCYQAWAKIHRPRASCEIEDCPNPRVANGLCQKHDQRVKANGSPYRDWDDIPADTVPRKEFSEEPPLPPIVLLRCKQCLEPFERDRGHVRKAIRGGWAGPFCGRRCSNRSRARTPDEKPTELIPVDALITTDVIRTETGRRRYYDDSLPPSTWCQGCGKWIGHGPGRTCWDCYMAARASTYVLRICDACGEDFELMRAEDSKKERAGQENRYCGGKCAADALRTGTPCEACGEPMHQAKGRRFCSEKCRKPSRTRTRKASGKKVLEEKPCEWCERPFDPRSSRARYCGRFGEYAALASAEMPDEWRDEAAALHARYGQSDEDGTPPLAPVELVN